MQSVHKSKADIGQQWNIAFGGVGSGSLALFPSLFSIISQIPYFQYKKHNQASDS